MVEQNPFAEDIQTDDTDLVKQVQTGSREALEALVLRHQSWIYNIVQRMVYLPQDAEDITQEILIRVITKLSTFEFRSSFRTWLYRIVVNHVLNMKRARLEEVGWTFTRYGEGLDGAPDAELPDPRSVPADVQLLVDEARIGCTSAMLLCLDREQRLIYVLGEIFGVSDKIGSDLLEVTRENFRQKLARARRDLHNFMENKCGLVNKSNPCRCTKKTQAFINAGYVNPHDLLFAKEHVTRVRDVAKKTCEDMESLDVAYAEIHRDHPFLQSPDFVSSVRDLLKKSMFLTLMCVLLLCTSCKNDDYSPDRIITMEKAALDRWGKGDPQGYLEIMDADLTYFDPYQEKRLDGLVAMKEFIKPLAGKIKVARFDMINPKVQRDGNMALLTFNLLSYVNQPDGKEKLAARWNSSEMYHRIDGAWKIVHSHWSYIKPELKEQIIEQ
jgi:RNA polymerase sigma factor (sigma-70 family)